MPKALIHYFSGTGNSLLAAKKLCNELNENEYETVFHPVEQGNPPQIEGFNLHIFFFPIYATSVPHIMRKYIRHLPDGNHSKAVVITTNGRISKSFRDGYQGWALQQARLYLFFKNYDVYLSDTLDYPHNVTIAIPPLKDKTNQHFINQAENRITEIAQKIIKGVSYHRKYFLPNILWSVPFGILYSLFGRRFIGKLFVADSSCTSCGLCSKKCPAKVIKKRSSVLKWSWNCEGCMRCLNTCPNRSIQVSLVRIIAFIVAACFTPLLLVQKMLPIQFYYAIGSLCSGLFNSILDFILTLILFMIFDLLIFGFAFVPGLKQIVSWGYTRLYGRYNTFKK